MVGLLRIYGHMLTLDTPHMDPAEWTCLAIFFLIVAIVTWICCKIIDDMKKSSMVECKKNSDDIKKEDFPNI